MVIYAGLALLWGTACGLTSLSSTQQEFLEVILILLSLLVFTQLADWACEVDTVRFGTVG